MGGSSVHVLPKASIFYTWESDVLRKNMPWQQGPSSQVQGLQQTDLILSTIDAGCHPRGIHGLRVLQCAAAALVRMVRCQLRCSKSQF